MKTLDEILEFQNPMQREHVIDATHLGTLFMLDETKEGQVYFEELCDFAATYSEKIVLHNTSVNFSKEFQGYCTLKMWNWVVSKIDGKEKFVNWFLNLFSQGNITYFGPEQTPFLSQDSVKTLHSLLKIDKTYGLEFISFFDLMQTIGEDMHLMTLNDEKYDYFVPLEVMRKFGNEFITGTFFNFLQTF